MVTGPPVLMPTELDPPPSDNGTVVEDVTDLSAPDVAQTSASTGSTYRKTNRATAEESKQNVSRIK